MEWTGKVVSVGTDWLTGEFNITLSINEKSALNLIDDIKDCEKLSIKAVKYRKKRSLDANAYCWVLCTEIANAIGVSKDDVYEEMIQKHGFLYQDEDGYVTITVKAEVDMSKISGHWRFYKGNGKFSSYMMIKGSSEYTTAEMAKFLDFLVWEAKERGIETATPDELERLKATWQSV